MRLRIGANKGALIADQHDVYGRSVNLAARLMKLAGPGEIIVSAEVRDDLVSTLDADIEDLGEHDTAIEDLGQLNLRHVANRVRAYRVGPPGAWPADEPGLAPPPELRATIAVIPFTARTPSTEHDVLGEVLADDVIAALSQTPDLQVISRLSTTALRGRDASTDEIKARLDVNYVVSGAYRVTGDQFTLVAELAETTSGRVLWGKSMRGSVAGVVRGSDDVVDRVVAEVSGAVIARELDRAQTQALPTLESHTLLMGAIALMHRASGREFDRAREMLEAVIDRARRKAAPHAWLAKWHVLRFNRGWSHDQTSEAQIALDCTKRALDADPGCSLALTVDGFIHTNLLKQLDVGEERYELALDVNPNDSLAWLLKGTLHAFKGEGDQAIEGTEHALRLSPLDPLRYFYDSLAATAALSAGRYERAVELAQRSLRANRVHTSTLRALAIAQSQLGRLEDARRTVVQLMTLDPTLTVSNYLQRSPGAAYETGKLWSEALRRAGVPD
jgi:TolB-like protein